LRFPRLKTDEYLNPRHLVLTPPDLSPERACVFLNSSRPHWEGFLNGMIDNQNKLLYYIRQSIFYQLKVLIYRHPSVNRYVRAKWLQILLKRGKDGCTKSGITTS